MLVAKELLEAFRDSFLNLDSEPLAAVTTPKSTITFTSTGETLNHREMLQWAKSGACYQLQDFVILKDMVRNVSLVCILRKEKTQMDIGMLNVFSLQI